SRLWNLLMPRPWCFLCMYHIFQTRFCIFIPTFTSPLTLTLQKILTHFPASFYSIFERILTKNQLYDRSCG
ncbi:hypothetical protein K435DRAFT_783218, partial [Dendrothele bispora CBS 962.96]